MQIVFQAALRRNEGAFDIDAVIAASPTSSSARHPHVFGAATGVDTSEQCSPSGSRLKQARRSPRAQAGPRARGGQAGPCARACAEDREQGGQGRLRLAGLEGSFAKIERRSASLRVQPRTGRPAIHHELGDLLFAIVNVARKLNSMRSRRSSMRPSRFRQRFEFIEDRRRAHSSPQASNLDEMMRCGRREARGRRDLATKVTLFLSHDRVERSR